jgi:hypothetical protein
MIFKTPSQRILVFSRHARYDSNGMRYSRPTRRDPGKIPCRTHRCTVVGVTCSSLAIFLGVKNSFIVLLRNSGDYPPVLFALFLLSLNMR